MKKLVIFILGYVFILFGVDANFFSIYVYSGNQNGVYEGVSNVEVVLSTGNTVLGNSTTDENGGTFFVGDYSKFVLNLNLGDGSINVDSDSSNIEFTKLDENKFEISMLSDSAELKLYYKPLVLSTSSLDLGSDGGTTTSDGGDSGDTEENTDTSSSDDSSSSTDTTADSTNNSSDGDNFVGFLFMSGYRELDGQINAKLEGDNFSTPFKFSSLLTLSLSKDYILQIYATGYCFDDVLGDGLTWSLLGENKFLLNFSEAPVNIAFYYHLCSSDEQSGGETVDGDTGDGTSDGGDVTSDTDGGDSGDTEENTDTSSSDDSSSSTTSSTSYGGGGGGGGGGGSYYITNSDETNNSAGGVVVKKTGEMSLRGINFAYSDEVETGIVCQKIGKIDNLGFSEEEKRAYLFAYCLGITTMPTISQARLNDLIARVEYSKMISNFAIKILDKKVNSGVNCDFVDLWNVNDELSFYAKTSCKLGLMGLNSDGTQMFSFFSWNNLTRGQEATVLSRLIWGEKYNLPTDSYLPFYYYHIKALNTAGIISVTNPDILELRSWIFLQLYRLTKNYFDKKVWIKVGDYYLEL